MRILVLAFIWVNSSCIPHSNQNKIMSTSNSFMVILYILALVLDIFFMGNITKLENTDSILNMMGNAMFFLVVMYPFCLLILLLVAVIVLAIILSFSWMVKATTGFFIRIFVVLKFEGLLIGIGSLLFLYSKYLEIWVLRFLRIWPQS